MMITRARRQADTSTGPRSSGVVRTGKLSWQWWAALLLMCAGCSTLRNSMPPATPQTATLEDPAVRVLCMWQPVEGRGLDDLPTPGFAGQIAFLTAGSPEPVRVEGDVSVYLFDDQGTEAEQQRPLRRFNFLGGAWQMHEQETSWGPTYQIFIPYVREGTHQARCALCVQLRPPGGGPVVRSDLAHVTLPGE